MSEQRNGDGQQHLFDGLIATYRDLNLKVRPLPEDRMTIGRSGETIRDVMLDLRDDELRFSQALKDRLTGEQMVDIFKNEARVAKAEIPSADDTTVEVISQFGTARESTLAMLQGLAPDVWDDGNGGPLTIRAAANALLANDRVHMEKIVTLLGSPTG